MQICPLPDSASTRAFSRFQTNFAKHYTDLLTDYSEEALFNDQDGAYNELFEFISVNKPRKRGFEPPVAEPKRNRARTQRGGSVATEATSDEDEATARNKRERCVWTISFDSSI